MRNPHFGPTQHFGIRTANGREVRYSTTTETRKLDSRSASSRQTFFHSTVIWVLSGCHGLARNRLLILDLMISDPSKTIAEGAITPCGEERSE